MPTRALVDTDVILDLLTGREPHGWYAGQFFDLAQTGQWQAFATPVIFANLFYILRKVRGKQETLKTLNNLRSLIAVLPMDQKIVDRALTHSKTDFEDALQIYAAQKARIRLVVTRNVKDFKESGMTVRTPREIVRESS